MDGQLVGLDWSLEALLSPNSLLPSGGSGANLQSAGADHCQDCVASAITSITSLEILSLLSQYPTITVYPLSHCWSSNCMNIGTYVFRRLMKPSKKILGTGSPVLMTVLSQSLT
jgi:hypothetical protein